ncbi:MAG TPA: hypothetical protein VFD77_08525 [Brumimicrobium sp.]|nr:hypothetical protein [Brumimicrobium sp.]
MRIKATLIFGLTFLLLSCGQQTDQKEKSSTESKTEADSATEKNEQVATTVPQNNGIVSPYQQELNKALADTAIDDYYKEIYRQEKLISAHHNKMLSIRDSLFTDDPDKDLFYFIVFTKSMRNSDGFYSEAVGLSSFEFVRTKTEKFADYFNIAPNLTDQDMDNWAQYVYGEIQISRENQEEQAVNELESELLDNMKEARKEYRVIIEKFIEKIKSTMP